MLQTKIVVDTYLFEFFEKNKAEFEHIYFNTDLDLFVIPLYDDTSANRMKYYDIKHDERKFMLTSDSFIKGLMINDDYVKEMYVVEFQRNNGIIDGFDYGKHPYVIHDDFRINGFFGKYRFLSNFTESPVYYEGLLYPSTEAAYQAAKSRDEYHRHKYTNILAKQSKALGRTLEVRSDWEDIKIDVMSSVVFDKFLRNKELREQLIATGDRYLEETNYWKDRFWGVCDGTGQNNLGKILMNTRDFFKPKTYEKKWLD